MPDCRTIFAEYNGLGGQWVAYFDGDPCHAFGGDLPAVAVLRILEGEEAEPGGYLLLCDADLIGSRALRLEIEWKPAALFFPCQACKGRGEYVGLLEREVCHACKGRNVVPVRIQEPVHASNMLVRTAHLEGLKSLRCLSIHDDQISDAGLIHLKKMTALEDVNLAGTRVTDAEFADLRPYLPLLRRTLRRATSPSESH